jgi:hypothetical protein
VTPVLTVTAPKLTARPTRRIRKTPMPGFACPGTGGHGTRSAYERNGCRCPDALRDCSRASVRRQTDRERKLPLYVDGTGTRRRVQALLEAGYSTTVLGTMLDCSPTRVQHLATRARVHRNTAERVAQLYAQLAAIAPADHPLVFPHLPRAYRLAYIARARRYATTRGFQPVMAWTRYTIDDPTALPDLGADDDVDGLDADPGADAVADAVADVLELWAEAGDAEPTRIRAVYTRARDARQAIIVALSANPGPALSEKRIAALLGISDRTVTRARADARKPATDGEGLADVADLEPAQQLPLVDLDELAAAG